MKPIDTSPLISEEQVKQIELIIVRFLFYACGVDNTFLVPLNAIASRIYLTEKEEKNLNQLLDYMSTHPNAVVHFTLHTWFYVPTPMHLI